MLTLIEASASLRVVGVGYGQRPRRVVASGERGRFGLRCCVKHNGNYQSL